MTWATWIASLIPGVVSRVLAALGLGVVTITGLTATTDHFTALLQQWIGGLPADVIGVMNLAGFGEALNIVVGALAARVAYHVLAKAAIVAGVQ